MRVPALVGLVCGGLLVVATARAQSEYVDLGTSHWPHEVTGTVKVTPGRFSMAATSTYEGPDTGTGSVYVVGRYSSPYSASPNMVVRKVDGDGTELWTAQVPIPVSTDADGIAVISNEADSAVFVTGWYEGSNGKDIVTAGLDNSGNVTWTSYYNNMSANKDDYPVTIAWDQAGHFIYVGANSDGSATGGSSTGPDLLLLKYDEYSGADASGWSTPFRYGGTAGGKDTFADIGLVHSPPPPGGEPLEAVDLLFVAGTVLNTAGGLDYATIWINPDDPTARVPVGYDSGAVKSDVLTSMAVYASAQTNWRVVVTGYSNGQGTNTDDYATIAYMYNGDDVHPGFDLAWGPMPYNGTGGGSDRAVKVVISDNGGSAIVTGESWGGTSPGTGYDFLTRRYQMSNGGIVWTNRFNNPAVNGEDRPADLIADKNGNTYVGGKSYNGSSFDYCAVSYLLNGLTRWDERITGNDNYYVLFDGAQNGSDVAGCLRVSSSGGQVDHDGDVFLYGLSAHSGSQFTVIKYTQTDQ
jgi:hypothetical protein